MTHRAFTLAEVMAGLLFLTIAVFGLVGAYVFTLRAQTKSEKFETAARLARTSLNQVEAGLTANFDDASLARTRSPLAGEPGYELAVALTPQPDPDLKRVDLAIYWNDAQGPHDYSVWLVVARP